MQIRTTAMGKTHGDSVEKNPKSYGIKMVAAYGVIAGGYTLLKSITYHSFENTTQALGLEDDYTDPRSPAFFRDTAPQVQS